MLIISCVVAAMFIAGVAIIVWQNHKIPSLGHANGKLMPLGKKPNGVSTQTGNPAKQVEVLPWKTDAATTLLTIKRAIRAADGADIKHTDSHYVYAVFTTPHLQFHDDVEFLLDDARRIVHFRSQSRAGYSDLGTNRKRYHKLRRLYSQ